jgi:Fe-S-cluster-containing hydrogenase component 2
MSDFVVHKGHRAADSFARGYGADVSEVQFQPNEPTTILLADGRAGAGSCVGCGSSPCIEKHSTETGLLGALEAFPGDPNLDVCPTRAIQWDRERAVAKVSASDCIGCGLCVSRCPYGAISLAEGLAARVETSDPDGLVINGEERGEHATPERKGQIAFLSAPAAENLPATVGALADTKAALLVRNLLNEVGLNARVRRRGDTNMRIDAVGFSRSERPFVAEIELSGGVLDSPRALLEDVAVLHARYGYAVADIDPVSIILAFPNVRSEYYQVIRDIETVLGLRCRTITVGALTALLWTGSRIDGFVNDAFVVGEGTIDLAASLGIDERLLREPYPGAFTPAK